MGSVSIKKAGNRLCSHTGQKRKKALGSSLKLHGEAAGCRMTCKPHSMKRMVGCDLLWLAVAFCILTLVSPSTTQQDYGSLRDSNFDRLNFDCGAPDTPDAGVCFDPCQNYTILDDPSRSTENKVESDECDDQLHGWYRFVGEGGVKMPETCVDIYRCHTFSPMWLNGSHPILGDGIVSRTACAHWNENCCFWSSEVQVKACSEESGHYHVYRFQGTPECSLRYCTAPKDPSTALKNCEVPCRPEEECVFQDDYWACVCRQGLNISDTQSLEPQLDCGANEIKVKLDKCLLGGLGFKEEIVAYLNDRNCSRIMQNEPNNWVSMTIPVVASHCGNILESNRTYAIYTNTLFLATDFIIRDFLVNVNFQCAYPLDMKISLETALQPIVSSLNIDVGGAGEFTVRMALFQDQSYTQPYEGAKVVLPVESMLYVGAILERGDTSKFKLLLKNCYATPSEDRNDPLKYFIIRNSCPNQRDSTISIEENGVSSESRFSVQMFMFAGNYDLVFLHCEVYLCDSTHEQCKPLCSTSRLRSNGPAINLARVLDLGPITKRGAQTLDASNGTPSTAGTWIFLCFSHSTAKSLQTFGHLCISFSMLGPVLGNTGSEWG
ncbi:pancreatic secretory granule membrane major glycoprotein GP2 [Acomys russatus]|uniref:pancreatic secretory granule membrane major glycoprotein GP2 n=1 Tax=Acomys russatus TaxID=60746 RepID=UPI0021E1D406|nr:pancreatic secretory granule membrane major glycoprotein GP2 [Acomys russatus]